MEKNVPLIKKFKTENNYYIYDTWTNEILNVHKDFWSYLPDSDNGHISRDNLNKIQNIGEVKKEVEKAKKQGYLSTEKPEVATYYGWDNWKEKISDEINYNLQQISLNVTEKCNYRCIYCPYSEEYNLPRNHSNKKMSWSIARKSIEYALKHSNRNEPLTIAFYGGEPLCNFNLIKKVILFCKEKFSDIDIRYSMTTNGSLINENIAKLLIDNKFSLLFSIDGPQKLHDRYRRTINGKLTYDLTMKGFNLIKKLDIDERTHISVNCLLSPPFDISAIDEFVRSIDEEVRVDLASDHKTNFYNKFDMEKEYNVYNLYINNKFSDYKNTLANNNTEDRDKLGKSLFEKRLLKIAKREMSQMKRKTASHGQCIPGAKKLFVSSDGLLFPCERVIGDYCIGNISEGIDFNYIYDILKDWSNLFKNICKDCWAIRFCGKCFAYLDSSDHFQKIPIESICLSKKKSIEQDLIRYCTILELNPKALDFVKNIYIK